MSDEYAWRCFCARNHEDCVRCMICEEKRPFLSPDERIAQQEYNRRWREKKKAATAIAAALVLWIAAPASPTVADLAAACATLYAQAKAQGVGPAIPREQWIANCVAGLSAEMDDPNDGGDEGGDDGGQQL